MTGHAEAAPAMGRLQQIASRLADLWAHGLQRSELDGVSSAEVARMAQDLGLSQSDLARLAERDGAGGLLLYKRLEQLGLTQADIEKAGFRRDLERTCGLCQDQGDCRHDLEMRADSDEWKAYCPNSRSLEMLQAEKKADAGKTCEGAACCCKT
jgi:hypothetical protein